METLSRKSLADAAEQSIRAEITAGNWRVGEQLPNEASLSAKLGVSRGTVREAVRALVAQGMLKRGRVQEPMFCRRQTCAAVLIVFAIQVCVTGLKRGQRLRRKLPDLLLNERHRK